MSILVALWLLSASSQSGAPEAPTVRSASDILKVAHGSELPTVVHFWASWCKPCVEEMPGIRRLALGLKDLNARLVLVSLDETASTPDAVLRHFGLGGSNVVAMLLEAPDPKPITTRFNPKWQAELPATFLVLQSGEVVASHLGTTPVEVVLEEVRDRIATTHAGQPAPARRTK